MKRVKFSNNSQHFSRGNVSKIIAKELKAYNNTKGNKMLDEEKIRSYVMTITKMD